MTLSHLARGFALLLALPITACAVESADAPTESVSSQVAAPGTPGETARMKTEATSVNSASLFGAAPTLSAALLEGAISFTGKAFSPNAEILVGVYTLESGGWVLQSPLADVTSSPMTCSRTFCLLGGAIEGTIPWTRGCEASLALRAYDAGAGAWVSAPIPVCEAPSAEP